MAQRKSGEFRVEDGDRPARRSDFPRPDAEPTKEDAPAQERESGEHEAASKTDEAHGHGHDSGCQGSGEAPANVTETRTQKPGNGHAHSDEQIRSQIQQRLLKERAPRARHLLVSVGQGVVTLRGEVDDEAERKRLTDLVRGVGSVRELLDELSTRSGRDDVN